MARITMRMDPRCRKLNELSDQYHLLFAELGEKYIARVSEKNKLAEPLNYGDFTILSVVGDSETNTVSMAWASKKLRINPSTATRRVVKLARCGLVTKAPSPDDDRRYDIGLTEKGKTVLRQMNRLLYDAVRETYQSVTEDEMNAVYQYMDKCIGRLNELLKESGK